MSSRAARVAVPLTAFGVVAGVAGTVLAVTTGSGSTDHSAFVVNALYARPASVNGSISQSVSGLWSGKQVRSFTKVSGSGWLNVNSEGLITGAAPGTAPAQPGLISVRADDGSTTDTISVAVPVVATGQAQRLEAASWNLDDAGANASYSAEQKQIQAIVSAGVQVIGVQESGGSAAAALAKDLGWYSYQSRGTGSNDGDLGLISAYPISDVTAPTTTTPALGATLDINGRAVRVWTTHLDESGYGPHAICFDGQTGAQAVAAEQSSTRVAQASAIATELRPDIAAATGAARTPVIVLGDLASPAASDWTAATSAGHCNAGAVDWPAPAVFAVAGLADSYRIAHADPVAAPGNTWSPLVPTDTNGRPEPQDRIDYVDYAGPLTVVGAESYYTGTTNSDGDVVSQWPSDHAAAVTAFTLGGTPVVVVPPAKAPAVTPSAAIAATVAQARVGSALRATTRAWPAGTALSYQWYLAGQAIRGATRTTFTPTATSAGRQVGVQVTGTVNGHRMTATAKTVTVRVGTLSHAKPRISGTAKVGKRLTAVVGSWNPAPKLTYRWYASGKPIAGATRSTLKITKAQDGKRITVRVTGAEPGYGTVAVASGSTAPVK